MHKEEDRREQSRKEDYARVLDYLPTGKSFSRNPEPLVQLIGESYFTLLEAMPKIGISLNLNERVYIGNTENREKISIIKRRISYDELTQTALTQLYTSIRDIVASNEARFVNFYNTAPAINMREHSLELLPGIGRKLANKIIEEREKKPFESFKELENRTGIPDPIKPVVERVVQELKGNEKLYLFVNPFIKR
ncbi:MAG: DNA polymerase III PolC-type [Candidatus Micrarchaeota archaeon]|nr:MAG: DNA polymerase III PolC-type [Candidatus Micrarchaeota archaeon]